MFVTRYQDIIDQIDAVGPVAYGRTRNFVDGRVTRDWMFPVTGYFPSFFGFWNKAKKYLK